MSTVSKEPSVAAIGGGTGLSTLLRGLRNYTSALTAVVCVTDDGGSSGRLREGLGMLPPGDIRDCLLALAEAEPLMQKIFQYRFTAGEGLAGHSLGNLLLAAMTDTLGFEGALEAASKVLAVRGRVLPVSLNKLSLVARFIDGSEITGESRITAHRGRIASLRLEPSGAVLYPAVRQAILEADLVVAGPGSLYTSILANLLVPGMVEAIRESRAKKVFVCNVMTQPGETDRFTAADHLEVLYRYTGPGLFDTIIVNTSTRLPGTLQEKYEMQGQYPVVPDISRLKKFGVRVVASDLLAIQGEMIRHDEDRLARLVLGAASENRGVSWFVSGTDG